MKRCKCGRFISKKDTVSFCDRCEDEEFALRCEQVSDEGRVDMLYEYYLRRAERKERRKK